MTKTTKSLIYKFFDMLNYDDVFSPRDVCNFVRELSHNTKNPMDSTVTRLIRLRRAEMHDIELASRPKSLYIKVKPTASDICCSIS